MNNLQWQHLMLFPDHPFLSGAILFLGVTFLLWMAREQVEGVIRRIFISVSHALRFAARWLDRHAQSLHHRADELAVEYFMSALEKRVEGDISRLSELVHKDLASYPDISHRLSMLITEYEQTFRDGQEAKLPGMPEIGKLNQQIENVLKSDADTSGRLVAIRKELRREHKRMLKLAKKDSTARIRALRRLRTPVHRLNRTVQKIDGMVSGLRKSIGRVESKISEYRKMRKERDIRLRAAHHSVMTRFAIGVFFLVIVVGGAFVNFLLIKRPIAEMIGGGYVGDLSLPSIGALMVILIEMGAGIMLAEALELSHLIPNVSHWLPEKRQKVAIVCSTLLLCMAGVEAGLAFMRELLIAADAETTALLTGQAPDAANDLAGSLPVVVQAAMGFVIPLILAFAAIPLEILFNTARIVLQRLLCVMMWGAAFMLRMLGNVLHGIYRMLAALYDLLIFFWLVVQRWLGMLFARFGRSTA